jgi:tetratricopeptide (TPR) repeat protein
VAKQGADALVFDIAQGLGNVEGMRAETVRKILGRAEEAFAKLVERSGDHKDLLLSQAAMLLEFADTYAAQGDTAKQMESAKASLAIFDRLSKSDPRHSRYQIGQAAAHSRIGDSLTAQGSLPDALNAYRQSLAVADALLMQGAQQNRATFHDKVANTLLEQGVRFG